MLPFCGIGMQGVGPLAKAMTPVQLPHGKPVLQPKLTHLDLQVPSGSCDMQLCCADHPLMCICH